MGGVTSVDVDALTDKINVAKAAQAINPLAIYLHPIQKSLGFTLVYVRKLRRLVSWEDYRLTLWVFLILIALAILSFVFIRYLPWSFFILELTRIVVFAATGPHMFLVGQHFEDIWEAEARLAAQYDTANTKGKEAILATKRDELMDAAAAHVRAVLAKRAQAPPAEAAKLDFLRDTPIKFRIDPLLVSGERYIVGPDPSRSFATPIEADAPDLSPVSSRLSGLSEINTSHNSLNELAVGRSGKSLRELV